MRLARSYNVWGLVCAFALTQSALAAPATFVVDDFDVGVANRLGGYRNVFQRAPSTARSMRITSQRRGSTGRSFELRTRRRATGFCGAWVHLFNFRQATPRYFDASSYSYLTFWVKGRRGGEKLLIKMADRDWIKKEDALPVARAEKLLPKGITQRWQEVRVSLHDARVDLKSLGAVIFEMDQPGQQTVYIDDIAFKKSPAAVTPFSHASAVRSASGRTTRAMWIWETAPLLKSPQRRQQLWSFCRTHEVGLVWLQLLHQNVERRYQILHSEAFARLLGEAHEAGIQVHGLDGYPEYALREFHHVSLGVVQAVIDFNRGRPKLQRFDGIHLDNEPYLLVGWQDAQLRQQILQEYLQINEQCQRLARTQKSLAYGVDIPFWWHQRDAQGQYLAAVEFRGVTKPVSFHCLDLLDNVGIMNYRDQAHGADGMIAHGAALLRYADGQGKAAVFMGTETFRSTPAKVWFLVGPERRRWTRLANTKSQTLPRRSRLLGQRLHTFVTGGRIHVGVEVGNDEGLTRRALRQVATELRLPAGRRISDDLIRRAGKLPRFSNLQRKDFDQHPAFLVTTRMLSKVTFADDSTADFWKQTNAAEDFFRRFKSYRGTAIHCYKSFRELLQK